MIDRLLRPFSRLTGDHDINELVRGSLVTLFFRLANFGLGYLFVILITQNFGAGTMGRFALATTIVTIASVIARIGLDTSLIRFVAEQALSNRRDLATAIFKKARNFVTISGLSISVGLYSLAQPLARALFQDEVLTLHFQLASLAVLPLTLTYLYSGYFQGLGRIREFAFIQNASVNLFATIALSLLIIFSNRVEVPLVAYLWGVGCTVLISVYLGKKLQATVRVESPMPMRRMLRISTPFLLASSMGMIMGWADIVILGIYRSEEEVGIYSVVMKLSLITMLMLRAVNGVVAPRFARLYKTGNLAGMQRVARQSTSLIFWVSLPIFLVFLLSPASVLKLFGSEFTAGRAALIYLTIGMFVGAISGSVGSILQMTGRQVLLQNVIFVALLLNIGLNFALIPILGVEGAAIASMVTMLLRNLVFVLYIRLEFGILTIYLPGLSKYVAGQNLPQGQHRDASGEGNGAA